MSRHILLVFNIQSNIGREQLSGVFRFMGEHPGWIPRLISSKSDFTPEVVETAESQGFDGIIANDPGVAGTAARLKSSTLPLAILGIKIPELKSRRHAIIFTSHDNPGSGKLAAEKFFSYGVFSSFCYVHPRGMPDWSKQREQGFSREIRRHSPSAPILRLTLSDTDTKLIAALRRLPKPAALLAANDFCAMEVIQSCTANGIAIPKEVSIIGAGNDEIICANTQPQLSSITFDFFKDGYEAASELEKMISSSQRRKSPRMIACRPLDIIDRESAAPVAPSVALVRRARDYIKAHAHEGISSHDVAQALGVSDSLLALRFREILKISVLTTINDARIEIVKRLLRTTSRPIFQITHQCGFKDANNLKRLFRQRIGMSMREYRTKAMRPVL